MKENKNKQYCAPEVEVLDARVEKGFAGSPQPDQPVTPSPAGEGGFNAGGDTGWSGGNTDDWWS